jgi:hypothetical protein
MPRTCMVQVQMETKDIEKAAADLYWLAFVLTGRRDISIDIAVDATSSGEYANSFFADWMRGWRRRLVIGKALTAIHDELAESARRTKGARERNWATPRNWSLSPDIAKADLERALLTIDLFPRATLLLLVFEGVRIADAATLLNAKPKLLKKAQAIGLRELTANLAAPAASAEGRKSFLDSMRTGPSAGKFESGSAVVVRGDRQGSRTLLTRNFANHAKKIFAQNFLNVTF